MPSTRSHDHDVEAQGVQGGEEANNVVETTAIDAAPDHDHHDVQAQVQGRDVDEANSNNNTVGVQAVETPVETTTTTIDAHAHAAAAEVGLGILDVVTDVVAGVTDHHHPHPHHHAADGGSEAAHDPADNGQVVVPNGDPDDHLRRSNKRGPEEVEAGEDEATGMNDEDVAAAAAAAAAGYGDEEMMEPLGGGETSVANANKRRRVEVDDSGTGMMVVDSPADAIADAGGVDNGDMEDANKTLLTEGGGGGGSVAVQVQVQVRRKNPNFPPPKKLNQEQWDMMFNKLLEYKERYGDTLVPKRYKESPQLGTWVETQRVQYKKLLKNSESLGLGSEAAAAGGATTTTTEEQKGQDNAMDVDGVDEGGGGGVSGGAVVGEKIPGVHFPIIPSKRLNTERLQRLTDIDFAWSARTNRGNRKSSATGTNTTAPTTPGSSGKQAGVAVRRQGGGGSPSAQAAGGGNSSNSKPPSANRRKYNDTQWNDMYDKLVAYRDANGDCLVPKKWSQDPRLGTWVETQRVLYKREFGQGGGGIRKNTKRGGTAGGPPLENSMEPGDGEDAASAARKDDDEEEEAAEPTAGSVAVDMAEEANSKGGEEVQNNEAAAAAEDAGLGDAAAEEEGVDYPPTNRRLTDERKDKLEAIGFVWSLRAKKTGDFWESMFSQLLDYKEEHGDCLVPSRYEDNLKLGKWVECQRYEYTKLMRAREEAENAASGEVVEADADAIAPTDASTAYSTSVAGSIAGSVAGGVIADSVATSMAGSMASSPAGPGKKKRATTIRLTEERLKRLEDVGFEWKVKNKMRRYYEKQWDNMFAELVKYQEEHGDCMVPKRYPPVDKLGTWVHTQRIQYRRLMDGKAKKEAGLENGEDGEEVYFRLTDDRRQRLDDIGFVWAVREAPRRSGSNAVLTRNSYDDQWDAMFERLVAWKERSGNVLVPKRCKEDKKLGCWVDTQRVQYKRLQKRIEKAREDEAAELAGGKSDADAEGTGEAADLASPGVKTEEQSTETAGSLTTETPGSLTTETPGSLTSPTARPLVGRLTQERIRRLEELGFAFALRDDWKKHYQELVDYKQEHGDCNVPARYAKNRRLGIWVSAQRQQYKIMNSDGPKGKPRRSAPLTPERMALLNSINFTWTIRSRDSLGESWNLRLSELTQYREEHGNCLVPSRYPPNPELGVWVGTQRTQYRIYQRLKEEGKIALNPGQSSAMNEGRVNQLNELGFVWALRANSDSTWKKRIAELEAYKSQHGDPNVPSTYKANPRLGSWAAHQRMQYRLLQESKPSTLDEGKINELTSLGFNWDLQDEPIAAPEGELRNLLQPSVVVPPLAPIQAPPIVAAPEPEVVLPAPAPVHVDVAPPPIHVHTAPVPVHTLAAPVPIHTHAAPVPVHTLAAPAPVHTHAAPVPVHTLAAPAPVHTHAAPAPVHTHAAPAPVHTHAAPAPVHVDASGQFPQDQDQETVDSSVDHSTLEPIPVNTGTDASLQPAGVAMAASMAAAGDLVAAAGAEQLAANIAEQMLNPEDPATRSWV